MPVLAEQEVGRLDVTMDDSLGVGVVEGPAGLKEDGQDLCRAERPAAVEDAAQTPAGQVFGDQVGVAVDAPIEDPHHL